MLVRPSVCSVEGASPRDSPPVSARTKPAPAAESGPLVVDIPGYLAGSRADAVPARSGLSAAAVGPVSRIPTPRSATRAATPKQGVADAGRAAFDAGARRGGAAGDAAHVPTPRATTPRVAAVARSPIDVSVALSDAGPRAVPPAVAAAGSNRNKNAGASEDNSFVVNAPERALVAAPPAGASLRRDGVAGSLRA